MEIRVYGTLGLMGTVDRNMQKFCWIMESSCKYIGIISSE